MTDDKQAIEEVWHKNAVRQGPAMDAAEVAFIEQARASTDAEVRDLTETEQRALHKALLASGKVLYRFPAPSEIEKLTEERDASKARELRLYNLVLMIANDQVELSHEKAVAQRDWYRHKCRALLKDLGDTK